MMRASWCAQERLPIRRDCAASANHRRLREELDGVAPKHCPLFPLLRLGEFVHAISL